MRKRYTAEQREKLIAEVRATRERAGVVAKRMGVAPSTAYLWMKAAAPVPSAPGVREGRAGALGQRDGREARVLEAAAAKLHVERDVDPALLRQVVAALSALS